MNRVLRSLFACLLLTSLVSYGVDCCNPCNYDCNNCCLGPCDGYPFLQIRSQGRDSARELVGWQQFINKYDQDCTYGAFSLAVEYTRSFRNERLAHFLFGNDLINCCELYIQGSEVENRNKRAWMADYFGLDPKFDSRVRFCPQIQNAVLDFNLWLGFDEAAEGLYLRINAPIVWTKWQLCPCESVKTVGDAGYYAGYMSEEAVAADKLNKRFLDYMRGNSVTFGDMKTPLEYGRIDNCACTKTRLAEIDLSLGWNFVLEEDYHFGAFLYVAAPAGNRPCATRLFEPMVGNGKHWEFGGGISGSWIFWRDCECEEQYMGVWLEATIAHLFKACQRRSFDFCNKPNSRYMLLEEMTKDNPNEIGDGTNFAKYVYKENLIPAINWSTFNVDVRIDVQADIALKLGYTRCNWNFDLGYNLWARTGEKFCNDCCVCPTSDKLYAIKGDATIYGDYEGMTAGSIYPISASQSKANIYAGTNKGAEVAVTGPFATQNPGVDNKKRAWSGVEIGGEALDVPGTDLEIYTSVDPILVNRCDLNLGRSPSAITHKLFGNIGYAWKDRECCDYIPFLGIGAKVEFAQDNWNDCCCCDSCCDSCCYDSCCNTSCNKGCNDNCCYDNCCTRRGGVSQWGIWIKGGVAFD